MKNFSGSIVDARYSNVVFFPDSQPTYTRIHTHVEDKTGLDCLFFLMDVQLQMGGWQRIYFGPLLCKKVDDLKSRLVILFLFEFILFYYYFENFVCMELHVSLIFSNYIGAGKCY